MLIFAEKTKSKRNTKMRGIKRLPGSKPHFIIKKTESAGGLRCAPCQGSVSEPN